MEVESWYSEEVKALYATSIPLSVGLVGRKLGVYGEENLVLNFIMLNVLWSMWGFTVASEGHHPVMVWARN